MFGSKRRHEKRAAAAAAAARLEAVTANREALVDAWFGRDPTALGAPAGPPPARTSPAAPTVPGADPAGESPTPPAETASALPTPSVSSDTRPEAEALHTPDVPRHRDTVAVTEGLSFPPDVLPRIEQALIAIAAHARRLDARLDALERRLDSGLDALDHVATRADVDDLRDRTVALGDRIEETLTALRDDRPVALPALAPVPPPAGPEPVAPLFAPIPIPPRNGDRPV